MNILTLFYKILILVMLLTFCSQKSSEDILKLRVIYLPEHTDMMVPVTCESISYSFTFRQSKIISDKAYLASVSKAVANLNKSDGTNSNEIRIKVLIDYSNKTDTLCLGEYFTTLLNGEFMEDNPKLLDLIKSKIY